MDSEIAELRTMTRVTQLRQQIECKQEGSWMSVRDVPDDRSKGGTRKVTTYGRSMRSVTRSFTSDMDFGDILNNGFHDLHRKPEATRSAEPEAIVEFPDDEEHPSASRGGVEITEVSENGSDPVDREEEDSEQMAFVQTNASPTKKTSVVTLGQGNVVLIDQQDSNFKVTGNSKENILDGDPPQKGFGDKNDKRVKKVEFCKTEVHFAPDSGKVNIVETDEKPPSSQLLRRKKRLKKDAAPAKTLMPKLYFGGEGKELFFDDKAKLIVDDEKIRKHSFPVIREPSPLLSTGITSLNQLSRPDSIDSWDHVSKLQQNGLSSDYAVPEKVKHDIPAVHTPKMDDLSSKKSKIDLPGTHHSITPNKINFVGNVRKDTSHYALPKKKSSRTDMELAETIIPIKLDSRDHQNESQKNFCVEDGSKNAGKSKKCDSKRGDEPGKTTSYLGNVSPKLSKLIKNDIQHEFQLKQLEIMRKGRSSDVTVAHESREPSPKASHDNESLEKRAPVNIQMTPDLPEMKIASALTDASVGKTPVSPPLPKPRRVSEPVYVNNQAPKSVSRTIKVVQEKTPQPRISLTKICTDDSREKRRNSRSSVRSSSSMSDRSPKKTTPAQKPRETPKIREIAHVKPMVKQCPRSTLTRLSEPCKRTRTPSRVDTPQDTVSRSSSRRSSTEKSDARTKKSKEPLRSFEKVSNGWVGHCIVPIKASKPSARVTVTTTTSHSSHGASSTAVSSKIHGSKNTDGSSESKLSHSAHVTNKFQSKGGTLTVARKQFSLSKEHLKSAKLVKELFNNKEVEQAKPDLPRPRNSEERTCSNRQRTSLVTRRRLLYEDSANANRFRRDSEQSDDSVVRADEEVRAYMFSNSKKKINEPK